MSAPHTRAASPEEPPPRRQLSIPSARRTGLVRSIGLGFITGAADDDPSAIGTYASAGAKLGPSFLWTVPVMFPMMVAVVYLSSKLGLVTGQGLFAVVRCHYPRGLVFTMLVGVTIANVIEAAADIGGVAAAFNLLVPMPAGITVVLVGLLILALQIWASYTLIRNVFRFLALALLAYIGSALLAHPDVRAVLRGSFVPAFHFDKNFLNMIVAVIGSSLSAYLYTWQSNEEVEEKIAAGKRKLWQRRGVSRHELSKSMWDIVFGMFFSNVVMYFIMLSTAATLFKTGHRDIGTAAEAAQALQPLAGGAASLLFAAGIIGVGFLAVPVMTTGAAYNVCQSFGWRHGLYRKPGEAKNFYIAIALFTCAGIGLNFFGVNPMKALVLAAIVQGFSTPPLMLLIMRLTNNSEVMGKRVNGRGIRILGWITTIAIAAASIGLVISWIV